MRGSEPDSSYFGTEVGGVVRGGPGLGGLGELRPVRPTVRPASDHRLDNNEVARSSRPPCPVMTSEGKVWRLVAMVTVP